MKLSYNLAGDLKAPVGQTHHLAAIKACKQCARGKHNYCRPSGQTATEHLNIATRNSHAKKGNAVSKGEGPSTTAAAWLPPLPHPVEGQPAVQSCKLSE